MRSINPVRLQPEGTCAPEWHEGWQRHTVEWQSTLLTPSNLRQLMSRCDPGSWASCKAQVHSTHGHRTFVSSEVGLLRVTPHPIRAEKLGAVQVPGSLDGLHWDPHLHSHVYASGKARGLHRRFVWQRIVDKMNQRMCLFLTGGLRLALP